MTGKQELHRAIDELSEEQVQRLSEASAPEDIYPYRFIQRFQRV